MPYFSNLFPIQALITNMPYNVGIMGLSGIASYLNTLMTHDPCDELRRKINEMDKQIRRRHRQLLEDYHDLYIYDTVSYMGHQQKLKEDLKYLKRLLEEFDNNGCSGGLPPGIRNLVDIPIPIKPLPGPRKQRKYPGLDFDETSKTHPVLKFILGVGAFIGWAMYAILCGA
jgi:hypothetical protein